MDTTTRNLERLAAMGDVEAAARLAAVQARKAPRTEGAVRFMKHYVTDGVTKARVSYHASKAWTNHKGEVVAAHVSLYAKDYEAGDQISKLFDQYENNTDSQTDYFETGTVRIADTDPLYASALARAEQNETEWQAHRAKVEEKRAAKRAERLAPFRQESAAVAAFLRGSA